MQAMAATITLKTVIRRDPCPILMRHLQFQRRKEMIPKKSKTSFGLLLTLLSWILCILFFTLFLLSRRQANEANEKFVSCQSVQGEDLNECQNRNHALKIENREIANSVKNTELIERENSRLKEQVETLNGSLKTSQKSCSGNMSELQNTVTTLRERGEALSSRIDLLKRKIERESYRDALDVFGPSPHQVYVEVDLPRDSEKDAHLAEDKFPSFVIELFPLKEMPHSVHLFLQQVYHGLWDDCHFVVNAPHILQAGTYPIEGPDKGDDEKIKQFERVGLDIVHFQEYNNDFPHTQWTVGFAGRPGGPDFYINKLDNTENHGPHGQSQHSLEEEADPCFGKIVEGQEVLERIFAMEAQQSNDWLMINPVRIRRARIIEMDTVKEAQEVPHLSEMHA